MNIDWQVDAEVDGLLTRDELRTYIKQLEMKRANEPGQARDWIDVDLANARKMLRDMETVNADAIDRL